MSYAPYPAYKENKIPWLGAIPEGWEVKALRYIGKPIIGLTYSPTDVVGENEGTLVLRASNIQKGKISLHDNVYVSAEIPEKLRIKAGDILVCSRNGSRHLIGKNALIEEDHDHWSFGAFTTVIRSEYGPFLYWVMNSKMFEYQSGRFLTTTINQLTTGVLNTFEIPFPPIEEQTAIANFLDDKTTEIDDLIAKKEELLRLLAEQRTALITHAVTKGLNPDAPMKPSGIDWLGDVPEGWDVVPFKWCCQVQSGQVDPKLDEYKGLPLIAPDHIESGTGRLLSYESAEEQGAISGKYQFEVGEVLYSKIRPELSKVALAPEAGLCSADMYAIRAMAGLRPEFLFFQMLSRHFHRFAVLESMRVAMPKINREGLGVFPVMVPDEDTQGKILDHIRSELSKMDLAEEKITTARDHLKEYRSAVITNAVTGKIKVA